MPGPSSALKSLAMIVVCVRIIVGLLGSRSNTHIVRDPMRQPNRPIPSRTAAYTKRRTRHSRWKHYTSHLLHLHSKELSMTIGCRARASRLISKTAHTHQSNETTRVNHYVNMPMTSSTWLCQKTSVLVGVLETSAHLDLELTRWWSKSNGTTPETHCSSFAASVQPSSHSHSFDNLFLHFETSQQPDTTSSACMWNQHLEKKQHSWTAIPRSTNRVAVVLWMTRRMSQSAQKSKHRVLENRPTAPLRSAIRMYWFWERDFAKLGNMGTLH